jgi:hypothetical protein
MPELAYDDYIDVVNKKNINDELYGVCSDYCYKIANT